MKRLQNFKKDFLIWTHEHRYEAILLGIILVVASFMRLYRIADYMTFLGDEGRDVIIVRRFLTELHPMLIGPGTSIGNMYLGPLYYYLIAPSLLLANFSPVGPAVFIALMGIATVWLVWVIARDWFGQAAGLIAAFLYAIAPVTIIYSRSSWNPNIMPFFALITIYSMWKVWKSHQYRLIAISAVSFGFRAGRIDKTARRQSPYTGRVYNFLEAMAIYEGWLLENEFPLKFNKFSVAINQALPNFKGDVIHVFYTKEEGRLFLRLKDGEILYELL
jgi:hypothetical protein